MIFADTCNCRAPYSPLVDDEARRRKECRDSARCNRCRATAGKWHDVADAAVKLKAVPFTELMFVVVEQIESFADELEMHFLLPHHELAHNPEVHVAKLRVAEVSIAADLRRPSAGTAAGVGHRAAGQAEIRRAGREYR